MNAHCEMTKQTNDKKMVTDQGTMMRRAPMPESRIQKRFSMQGRMLTLLTLLVLGVLLTLPGKVLAAEAVTNGVLNGTGTWTFDVAGGTAVSKTNAYDATTTHTAGSGSAKAAVTGTEKGKTVIGTFRQVTTIPSGSTINAVSLWYLLDVNRNLGDSIVISLTYTNNSTVAVYTSGELTSTTWAQLTASPGTVLTQDVKEVVVTMTAMTQAGNPGSTVSVWADDISITYTAPAADTTPPAYSSSVPANGATGVALNNTVTINWNENVDCTTVTPTTVTISPSPTTWVKTSCSGSQAVFTPTGQTNSTLYTVTLETGIKDTAGNATTSTSSFSYTTAAPTPAHNLTSFTSNAPGTANPDGTTKYLFATIPSTAISGGADVTAWSVAVLDNGTTLTPANITVYVEYGGTQVVSGSPATIGTNFTLSPLGNQLGGSDWTFRISATAAAAGKQVQLRINSATGGTDAGAGFPKIAPASSFTTLAAGLTCTGCHGSPQPSPTSAAPVDGTRNATTGAVVGNHTVHAVTQSYACTTCHPSAAYTSRHRRGSITMNSTATGVRGGYYDKSNNAAFTTPGDETWAQNSGVVTGRSCNTTWCHGTNSDAWGTSPGGNTCVKCHGVKGTASPTNAQIAPGGTGTDTGGGTAATDDEVGAHLVHLTSVSNYTADIACTECHDLPAAANDAGHIDSALPAEFTWGTLATTGPTTPTITNFPAATATCTNYCHGATMTAGASGTDKQPEWNQTGYLTGTIGAADCNKCHGAPPADGGTHATVTTDLTKCGDCHLDTMNTGAATFKDVTKHINGVVEASGCTGCHGTDPKEYPPLSKWGTTRTTADGVGAHVAHIESTSTFMTKAAITGETDATGYWCAECHTTTRGAGGHGDGYPAEVSFANAVESKYNTHTATVSFEGDNNPDLGNGATCSVYCHGAKMPNGDTLGSARTPAWGQTLTGCGVCHGFPPTPTGTHSGITAGTQCGACHTATMTNGNAAITNTANHINGTLEVTTSCTGCHNGSGTGARKVGPSSSHTDPDGAGTTYAAGGNHCAVCHFAGTDHTNEATGTVAVVWDNRTMGTTAYDGTTTGTYRIHLRKIAGTETTEAEICWGCHWGVTVPSLPTAIKEFGNTQGAYTTGTLNQRNWFGATWTSANFAYKTGTINSFHQAVADMDTAITIDTAHVATDVATIGCTSCHDVHRLGNNGFTPAGAPYLRGSWTSNPFKEDGAPLTGHTWVEGDARGVVPRAAALLGVSGNNEYGGWQIEQNNASFTNTDYGTNATTSYAGLCSKCHTQAALEGMTWKGHDNAVSGFSAGSETNIFWQGNRMNWASAKKGTWEYGYIVNAGTTDARGVAAGKASYIGALRNAFQWADGIDPPAVKPQYTPLKQPSFTTGPVTTLDVTGTTAQANFHNFPCSKCHSPHASRLPRLSITNCLDVKHNSWDDGATFDPSSWSATTANIAKDLAYGSTAGNCHRYVGSADTNAEDGAETGWNTVTPW